MLKIRNLYAFYGSAVALSGVTCHVNEGEIVALIGANGAGKSTLLQAVSGLVRRSGEVSFTGKSLINLAPEAIVGLGVSQVPEGRQLFAPMSVAENLELGAYRRYRKESRSAINGDLEKVFELFPRLKERLAQKAGTLSGGEQQMLAIGRALMARPRLLLLDEPSLGLAPLVVEDIFTAIAGLRREGMTILLVEQNARAALKVADRGYVLETGRIILSGAAQDLNEDRQVTRAYLGRDYKEFTEGR
jgi:branched-chain amino acid transport system ATP-binding protein